jgi:hypothetical protein
MNIKNKIIYLFLFLIFILFSCIPDFKIEPDLPVQTINWIVDADSFYQFYTNDSSHLGYCCFFYYGSLLSPMTEVKIQLKKNSGMSDTGNGVIFHCSADFKNFYAVLIDINGRFIISKSINNVNTAIKVWTNSVNLIKGYNKINEIRVTRDINGNFQVYFNDVHETTADFSDTEIISGYCGFYAYVSSYEHFPNMPVDIRYVLQTAQ